MFLKILSFRVYSCFRDLKDHRTAQIDTHSWYNTLVLCVSQMSISKRNLHLPFQEYWYWTLTLVLNIFGCVELQWKSTPDSLILYCDYWIEQFLETVLYLVSKWKYLPSILNLFYRHLNGLFKKQGLVHAKDSNYKLVGWMFSRY